MGNSYFCKKLETTLHFLPNGIKYCCSNVEGPGVEITDFTKIDKTQIMAEKNKCIEMLNNGEIPEKCKGCVEYKEKSFMDKVKEKFTQTNSNLISYIIIDHFKQCDCSCIYCSQKKLYSDSTQKYEVLPIIQQLFDANMIDAKNLRVEFQGGNISVLNEFDNIIGYLKSKQCNKYSILTNMIKYLPTFKMLDGQSIICVSLDCGSKEVFKKIKNVDAFDEVVNNLKQIRKDTTVVMQTKYIVVKDVNDNKEELEKFLNIAKDIDPNNTIILEIDYNDTFMTPGKRFDVPKHYAELFEFAEKYCNENNLHYYVAPYTKDVINKGYSE